MIQLLNVLLYLKKLKIAHRDLKPENILLVGGDKSRYLPGIKLCDFGVSKDYTKSPLRTTMIGSNQYIAPEALLLQSAESTVYDFQCDIWSCGVLTYVLLFGTPPFQGDDGEIIKKMLSVDYGYFKERLDGVKDEALDFIDALLVLDPMKRLTVEKCLAHQWIKGEREKTLISMHYKPFMFLQYLVRANFQEVILHPVAFLWIELYDRGY